MLQKIFRFLGDAKEVHLVRLHYAWVIHDSSHSGLLEPCGTSTVRKAPGVRDMTTWSVIP
jgi:hypothetical protein